MAVLSRHRIAEHVVTRVLAGDDAAMLVQQVAAFLIEEHRERELDLLIREIYDLFEQHGIVVADVTTAHELTDELRKEIKALIGGKQVTLREIVRPEVLGGVKIETPSQQLDATVLHRLATLREKKIG